MSTIQPIQNYSVKINKNKSSDNNSMYTVNTLWLKIKIHSHVHVPVVQSILLLDYQVSLQFPPSLLLSLSPVLYGTAHTNQYTLLDDH